MRQIRGQFQTLFRTRAGIKFYGELGIPADSSNAMEIRPRRTLTVSKKAHVTAGDVVISESGTFLLGFEASYSETVHFKCFEITHRIVWSRQVSTEDFVTGLQKDSSQQIVDSSLPVIVEKGKIDQNIGIETQCYTVLTGADVQVGDRLGPWLVQSRKQAIGLNVLEVS